MFINFLGLLIFFLDGDDFVELVGFVVNFNVVVEEFFKSSEIKDRVVYGNGVVDVEFVKRFVGGSVFSGGGSFWLFEYKIC